VAKEGRPTEPSLRDALRYSKRQAAAELARAKTRTDSDSPRRMPLSLLRYSAIQKGRHGFPWTVAGRKSWDYEPRPTLVATTASFTPLQTRGLNRTKGRVNAA